MRPSLKALEAYNPDVQVCVCDSAAQPDGSGNPQIVTSDPAHWHRQSGMV